MAELIRQIVPARPSVIVIDKYFSPTTCRDEASTQALADAFSYAAAQRIHVVVGLHTDTGRDLGQKRELTPGRKVMLRSVPQVLAPSEDFRSRAGLEHSRLFAAGLIRLNSDEYKIPLTWPVYGIGFSNQWRACLSPQEESTTAPDQNTHICPSLALSAAVAENPQIKDYPRLQRYLRLNEHPLSAFINPSKIPSFFAADVMCGIPIAADLKIENCKITTVDTLEDGLAHRVVVIGEDDANQDRHLTPYGDVPGFVLQANYIEHLLRGRYFTPSPLWVEFTLTVAWIIIIELSFMKTLRPERTLLILLSSMLFVFATCWVLIALLGIMSFGGLPGSVLALVFRYAEWHKGRLSNE